MNPKLFLVGLFGALVISSPVETIKKRDCVDNCVSNPPSTITLCRC